MGYVISKVASIVKGELIQNSDIDYPVFDLATDSRNLANPERALFFAIAGKRHNGHLYIEDAYQQGVRCFIISQDTDIKAYKDAAFVRVKNTLEALQTLAAYHRSQFSIPVIAVTGSNGKTIVKDWLAQLLSEDKKVIKSPKSYNSQIGVPLSVWQMKESDQIAIFEAGISEPEEMDRLEQIIKPTIGIFTNIGQAHDENFIHLSQKVGEKLKLFSKVQDLIYCSDYYDIKERILKIERFKTVRLHTWAKNTDADFQIKKIEREQNKTNITGKYKDEEIKICIPFTDQASTENAINCWYTMLILGYKQNVIEERMMQLAPVAMRLELKEGINSCTIINDSYSSDINSLIIALDFLNQQKQHTKRTVILSDILQSGRSEDEFYSEVADIIAQKGVNRIIGIGKAIMRQEKKFNIEKTFYKNTEEFLENYHHGLFGHETILIKGARVFEFENISKVLQQKAHETVLEINLTAITNNLNYFKSLLMPTTKIMAMVKAFSYGSGSYEVANLLQYNRVDYLAVAYADEGVELRKAGITMPIMVMNPDEQSIDSIVQYNLEPEIYNFRILNILLHFLKLRHKEDQMVPIHIKLDTGMHRLGFEEADIQELSDTINSNKNILIQSVFSHLAASEDPVMDDFTQEQISIFEKLTTLIREKTQQTFLSHILNSSGIARFTDAQYDMVRLGIGMYGIGHNEETQKQLQTVSTLRTIISQIRYLKSDQTVGYNRKGVLQKDSKIGTISIGYADGINRKLGNGNGKVLINGKLVPFIGNICMDMSMIDLSETDAKEGDEVIIFGTEHPVWMMARQLDTIPYEIFTGLSRRIKRVYYQE